MRVETNENLVKRNRRIANFLFFFSMALLIGGFVVANSQLVTSKDSSLPLLLSWLVLPIGFISTMVSVRMTNQWVRRPHPEDAIQEGLKGVSKRSVLYNYYHTPARHILITPQGVYAFTTRFQDGNYVVDGDRWQSRAGAFGVINRFFRQDGIGNPTAEAQQAATHVKKLLESAIPDIEVQPVVIFVDPRARLELKNPSVPVLYADSRKEPNLRDYMRDMAQQRQQQETPLPQGKKKGGDKGKSAEDPKSLTPETIADALEEVTPVS
jgi:nuclease-like protein